MYRVKFGISCLQFLENLPSSMITQQHAKRCIFYSLVFLPFPKKNLWDFFDFGFEATTSMNKSSKVMEQSPRRPILETKIHAVKLYTSGIPHPETSHLYWPIELPYSILIQCPRLVQVRSAYAVGINMHYTLFFWCLLVSYCWCVNTLMCACLCAHCVYMSACVHLHLYLCAVLPPPTHHQYKICTHMCTGILMNTCRHECEPPKWFSLLTISFIHSSNSIPRSSQKYYTHEACP